MSMESAWTTLRPPPASSLATPPEFYLDENAVTRRTASASAQPVPPRLSAHGENR